MRIVAALALAVLFAGCSSRTPAPHDEPGRVLYQPAVAQKSYGNCPSEDGCTKIILRWLTVVAAPTPAARESIDAFVRGTAFLAYDSDSLYDDEETMMMEFINDYRSFARSNPDAAAGWRFERRIDHLSDTLGVSSLAVNVQQYTGGAHTIGGTTFANFDVRTGRSLGWSDLLLESARPRLDSLGERAFRRVRKLDPNEDLGAAGFMFEGGAFHLNNNFAVTTTGLLFFFNDYEVGPHSLGATVFTLPWADVADCVLPDGPLGRNARRP